MAIPVASVVYLWKLVFQPMGLLNRLPWLAAGPGGFYGAEERLLCTGIYLYLEK